MGFKQNTMGLKKIRWVSCRFLVSFW